MRSIDAEISMQTPTLILLPGHGDKMSPGWQGGGIKFLLHDEYLFAGGKRLDGRKCSRRGI